MFLGAMADLADQQTNLLLVSFLLGRIVGHGNEQTSSIRLGPERRGNKVPESLAAILGVDYQFSRLHLFGIFAGGNVLNPGDEIVD
jgi:hypothetical protein